MEYSFKIRSVVDGKIQMFSGSLSSLVRLTAANDIFKAIAGSLPEDKRFVSFSIMQFRELPNIQI